MTGSNRMGIREKMRELRHRLTRAYHAYRGSQPKVGQDNADKRERETTWEETDPELRQKLLDELVEDRKAAVEELDGALRGNNGHEGGGHDDRV